MGSEKPKESFRAISCLKSYFYFLRLFLKSLKNTLLNKHENNLMRLFLFFEVIFCLVRSFLKIASKDF